MIRRVLPIALAVLLLLPLVSLASAQTGGEPAVSLTSQYIVNQFGFAIVNETVAFQNNGTATAQIPTVQIGIPDTIASHSSGWVVVSQQQFTQTSVDNGNVTTFTVVPGSPSLGGGASVSFSLKTFLSDTFNFTTPSNGPYSALFLLSPSLNQEVSTMDSQIELPSSSTVSPVPTHFALENGVPGSVYSNTTQNVTPRIVTSSLAFSDASTTSPWSPMKVYSIVTTIVPSANASPQVEDLISVHNLANHTISSIPLTLLASGLTLVTVVPTTIPPTVDPTPVNLTSGALDLTAAPFSGGILAGDNLTFAIMYPLPKSDAVVSGTSVTVSIPFTLPIQAVVQNFTATIAPASGINPVGPRTVTVAGATPIAQGSVTLEYSVNLGWGAAQAVPIASLFFVAVFLAIGLKGRSKAVTEEEDEEEGDEIGERLREMIKSFEEKVSLFQQFESDMEGESQGSVSRADFSKTKNEIDSLKGKATGRLNAMRQSTGSQKYQDLLSQIQEASREEDRAAKDLVNLYDQYHSKRMREETFRRLLPTYKKRSDSAVNHLSDLLNIAQREGKQA